MQWCWPPTLAPVRVAAVIGGTPQNCSAILVGDLKTCCQTEHKQVIPTSSRLDKHVVTLYFMDHDGTVLRLKHSYNQIYWLFSCPAMKGYHGTEMPSVVRISKWKSACLSPALDSLGPLSEQATHAIVSRGQSGSRARQTKQMVIWRVTGQQSWWDRPNLLWVYGAAYLCALGYRYSIIYSGERWREASCKQAHEGFLFTTGQFCWHRHQGQCWTPRLLEGSAWACNSACIGLLAKQNGPHTVHLHQYFLTFVSRFLLQK